MTSDKKNHKIDVFGSPVILTDVVWKVIYVRGVGLYPASFVCFFHQSFVCLPVAVASSSSLI